MVRVKSADCYLTAATELPGNGTTCEWYQNRARMADYEGMKYPHQATFTKIYFKECSLWKRKDYMFSVLVHYP